MSLDEFKRITLEEFNKRFLSVRDELALRSLRGEPLLAEQQKLLSQLNDILDELLPKPVPLPEGAVSAMKEIRALVDKPKVYLVYSDLYRQHTDSQPTLEMATLDKNKAAEKLKALREKYDVKPDYFFVQGVDLQ